MIAITLNKKTTKTYGRSTTMIPKETCQNIKEKHSKFANFDVQIRHCVTGNKTLKKREYKSN